MLSNHRHCWAYLSAGRLIFHQVRESAPVEVEASTLPTPLTDDQTADAESVTSSPQASTKKPGTSGKSKVPSPQVRPAPGREEDGENSALQTDEPVANEPPSEPRGVISQWTRDHIRGLGRMGAPFYIVFALLVALVLITYVKYIPWGSLMGGDIGEYLSTATAYLHGKSVTFAYAFPVLPLFYVLVIVVFPNAVTALYVAGALSAVFLGGVFAAAYVLFYRDTRSVGAAIIGALILPTTPILLVEVSWTGQAQFAAMAFGLLALATLLKWGSQPTYLRALLSGCLLGLGVLCEGYSGTFFVLAFIFTGLLTYRLRLLSWSWVPRLAAWILPLLLTYGGLYALDGGSVSGSLDRLLAYGLGTPSLLTYLTNLYDHGAPIILGATIVMLFLYAVTVRLRPWSRPNVPPLVLGGLLALLPLALFLTSVPFTERAMYFLCVPLGAAAARLTAPFFSSLSAEPTSSPSRPVDLEQPPSASPAQTVSAGRSRWRHFVNLMEGPQGRITIAILVMLLVGSQIGLGSQSLPRDMTGYKFSASEVSDLTWLRGASGGLVYDGNLKGPTDFAAGRPIYPDLQPVYLNLAQQRTDAIDAATLLAGPQWISAGDAQVIDSNGTYGAAEPLILVNDAPFYLPSFYLDDALENFWFSPANNHNITYVGSLYYAETTTRSVVGGAEFLDSYSYAGIHVDKTTYAIPGVGVQVHLQFNFTKSIPRWITLRATASLPVASQSITSAARVATSTATEKYGTGLKSDTFTTTVKAQVANATLSASFLPKDQFGDPEFDWNLTNIFAGKTTVNAWLTFEWPGLTVTTPHVVEEGSLLSALGIQWVVVQKQTANEYLVAPRLKADPKFSLYESTPDYLIYHVV